MIISSTACSQPQLRVSALECPRATPCQGHLLPHQVLEPAARCCPDAPADASLRSELQDAGGNWVSVSGWSAGAAAWAAEEELCSLCVLKGDIQTR